MKDYLKNLFTGDITLNKYVLWLISALCLFIGIVIGITKAPWTHGVTIGSNNGNNNSSTTIKDEADEE